MTIPRTILFNDTSGEGHLGSVQVIGTIKRLCVKYGIKLIGLYERSIIHPDNQQLRAQLKGCDFVLINGEGTLHRSTPFTNNLLESCRHKPAVLINTVWEKMYIKDRRLFENVLLVSVRESLSYAQVIKTVDRKKVCITPDLIFDMDEDLRRLKIGYSDSYMDYLRGGLSQGANYFPMDTTKSKPDLAAYLTWMEGLDLYVTGRFHGVCLAAMLKKPFLAFPSNSHKIEGLLKDMRCPELLLESFEQIEEKRVLAQEAVGKAHDYALKAKKSIECLFKKIKSLL